MLKIDSYEHNILAAYNAGKLKSIASKSELGRIRAGARATAIKDKRGNVRLSPGDLNDIHIKALEEDVPSNTDCQRASQVR